MVSEDCPTGASPNPEEPAAVSMASEKAKEVDADLVMASDPDADSIGIAVKNGKGGWVLADGKPNVLIVLDSLIPCERSLGVRGGRECVCIRTEHL